MGTPPPRVSRRHPVERLARYLACDHDAALLTQALHTLACGPHIGPGLERNLLHVQRTTLFQQELEALVDANSVAVDRHRGGELRGRRIVGDLGAYPPGREDRHRLWREVVLTCHPPRPVEECLYVASVLTSY